MCDWMFEKLKLIKGIKKDKFLVKYLKLTGDTVHHIVGAKQFQYCQAMN